MITPGIRPAAAPAGAHLSYYGGPVLANVKVAQVLYGSGTYIPELTSSAGPNMATFYDQIETSGVHDWLGEYNTPTQQIGRGSFVGSVQITPSSANDGSTIDDANIQAELASQIQAGSLPAPDDNTLYMVNFPAGKTITQGGQASCQAFCAYHGSFLIGSQEVFYGVLPDFTGACASGCGNDPTLFNNYSSVASHELSEAITDAEVGQATTVGAPLAWYDNTNGEIGDICNAQQGSFQGTDGQTYVLQQLFSNQQSDCITTRAVSTTPDFSLSASPSPVTVTDGSSTTITVTSTALDGSTQNISLSVAGLPVGVTGTLNPTSVTAGSTSTPTLTADAAAAAATASVTITGASGSITHTATDSITVSTGTTGGGTCTHNECAVGGSLTSGCDSCATEICAQDSYCCDTTWDSICVGEASSICNETCN